jgi:hypothetical protein
MGGGVRGAVADPRDRGPDGPGDVEPGSFGFRAERTRPAAESGRGGELADQEVFLGAEPARVSEDGHVRSDIRVYIRIYGGADVTARS